MWAFKIANKPKSYKKKREFEYNEDEEIKWNPNLSTLSIGDIFIDKENSYDEVKTKYHAFILGVSDSLCEGMQLKKIWNWQSFF